MLARPQKNTPGSLLITGAAKRIGRAVAERFSRSGWGIHLHYNASAGEAEQAAAALKRHHNRVWLHRADLNDPQTVAALVTDCDAVSGDLAAIVNNASVFRYDFPGQTDRAMLEYMMRVNLTAPVMLTDRYHRLLSDRDRNGVVVNVLDNKVFALNPDYYSYTLSKSALLAATEMAAMAFDPRLRVCGVAPGITLISGEQSAENYEQVKKINPLGHAVSVADVAEMTYQAVTRPIATGTVLKVDAGQHLLKLPRDVAFLDRQRADP